MKLNEHQRNMLRVIAKAPSTAREFTHGPHACGANVIQAYLERMVEGDLIELVGRSYTITPQGQQEVNAVREVTPSRIFCNASTKGPYKSPRMGTMRPGADDHLNYESRGV